MTGHDDPNGPACWLARTVLKDREILRQLYGFLRGMGGHRWEVDKTGLSCRRCGGRVSVVGPYHPWSRSGSKKRWRLARLQIRAALGKPLRRNPLGPSANWFRRLRHHVGDCQTAMVVGFHRD